MGSKWRHIGGRVYRVLLVVSVPAGLVIGGLGLLSLATEAFTLHTGISRAVLLGEEGAMVSARVTIMFDRGRVVFECNELLNVKVKDEGIADLPPPPPACASGSG